MTNPDNAVGTNGAYNGRTSPNALNDILGAFTTGVVSGWGFSPKTGMTIQCGGSAGTRDVAIAEDNAGNKLSIDNRSGAPIPITIEAAPSVNSRIDAIVAYVDNPSTGDGSTTDNPTTCGIIAVKGTAAANPTVPDDAAIRAAITVDGATGGTAYYVKLAEVSVGTGVTTIGSGAITEGFYSQITAELPSNAVDTAVLQDYSVTAAKIVWSGLPYAPTTETVVGKWADGSTVYRRAFQVSTGPKPGTDVTISLGNSVTNVVDVKGHLTKSGDFGLVIGTLRNTAANGIGAYFSVSSHSLILEAGADRSAFTGYVVVDYIK